MAQGKRNWLAIIWPKKIDGDTEYCIKAIKELLIPGCMILHDKDEAQIHFHLFLQYDGPVPYKQCLNDLKEVLDDRVNTVQAAKSKNGALVYLIHDEEDNKYQYDPSEIIEFNGFNYLVEVLKSEDQDKYDREIKQFIHENKIFSYRLLSDIGSFIYPNWHRCIDQQPTKWVKYLISYENEMKSGIRNPYDHIIEECFVNEN